MKKVLGTMFAATLALSLGATAARADTVDFTLAAPTATAAPGGTASFTATLGAPAGNGAAVFLNGDTITFTGPQTITFDDSGLFDSFPASLAPGSSDTDVLFTAQIPTGVAFGSYTGSYTLEGSATEDAQAVLGTDSFTLNVGTGTGTSVTPEPSSWLLTASGIAMALVFSWRREALRDARS